MNIVALVFGAGGSVWKLKIRPALQRLRLEFSKQGIELSVWGVERFGRIRQNMLVDRWFCIDDPAESHELIESIRNQEVHLAIIASPNETHVGLLCFLLGKVTCIVVEKPLANEPLAADLAVKLSEVVDGSYCMGLDHYLAKPPARFVLSKFRAGELGDMIGEMREVRFSMIEGRGVEPERAATLKRGLSLDMAIHGFSLLLSLLNATGDVKEIEVKRAEAARYQRAPITTETAAKIDAVGNGDVACHLLVGKGILDDKRLLIRGTVGALEADFISGTVMLWEGSNGKLLFKSDKDDAYVVMLREAIYASCGLPRARNSWLISLPYARDALNLVACAMTGFNGMEEYPLGTVPGVFARRFRLSGANVEVYWNQELLERAALREILSTAESSIERYGNFVVVIPGGKSFLRVSSLLLNEEFRSVDLSQWHVFFSDEHGVLHTDENNNYLLAFRDGGWGELVKQGRMPLEHIHRIETESEGKIVTRVELEERIWAYREVYSNALRGRKGADLVVLGLGSDCHTASLLPGAGGFDNPLLSSEYPYDVVKYPESRATPDRLRASITPAGIRAANKTIMFAFGEAKSEAIRAVVDGKSDLITRPGSIICLVRGTVMTDEDGASLLDFL